MSKLHKQLAQTGCVSSLHEKSAWASCVSNCPPQPASATYLPNLCVQFTCPSCLCNLLVQLAYTSSTRTRTPSSTSVGWIQHHPALVPDGSCINWHLRSCPTQCIRHLLRSRPAPRATFVKLPRPDILCTVSMFSSIGGHVSPLLILTRFTFYQILLKKSRLL